MLAVAANAHVHNSCSQNRARGFIARRCNVNPAQVKNVIIWGNHSATQYPDVTHAYIQNPDGSRISVTEAVADDAWIKGDFVKVGLGVGEKKEAMLRVACL